MALSATAWDGMVFETTPEQRKLARAALEACANKAFLGFDARFADPTVRVCCLCPDREAVEWLCLRAGVEMTHTHCDPCHGPYMAKLRAQRPTSP